MTYPDLSFLDSFESGVAASHGCMDVKSIFGNARASIRPHGLVLRGDLFSVGQVGSGPWFDMV